MEVIVEAERSQVMHIHTYIYVHEVEKVVRRSGDAVRCDGQMIQ